MIAVPAGGFRWARTPRTGPAGIDTRIGSHLGAAAQEPPKHRVPPGEGLAGREPTASRTRGTGGDKWALQPIRAISLIKS